MSSQRKPQSRQNEVRPGAPRCSPRGYHRIYINVEVASEVWNVTGLTGLTGLGGADARHTKGGVSKSRLASAWRCRAWRLASTSSGGASPPSPALRASSPRRTRNAAFAAHEMTRKGSDVQKVQKGKTYLLVSREARRVRKAMLRIRLRAIRARYSRRQVLSLKHCNGQDARCPSLRASHHNLDHIIISGQRRGGTPRHV